MQLARPVDVRGDVRSRIIGAASRLLRAEGAQAVTTRAVAQGAGVQAPTIYRLFGDKDGLIDAVAEHAMATYVAEKSQQAASAAEASGDPVAEMRAAWNRHVEFGLANAQLYALLNAPGRSRSPATVAGIDVLRLRVRRIAEAGLLRVDERRALEMIHAAGAGAVLALLGQPADERDPSLSDAMFDAVAAAILATAPPVPDTGVSTLAVTFAAMLPELPALTAAERTLMAEWITRSIAGLQQP